MSMPASRVHLIRHGEVFNPQQVLYGRLPNFPLSERGFQMAKDAAADLSSQGRVISRLVASPLLRAQQSAEPVAQANSLEIITDDRLIEPFNIFEGRKLTPGHVAVRPHLYFHLRNPMRPSWGEPYETIVARMRAALDEQAELTDGGDLVLVSHQLPIWMLHLSVAKKNLMANAGRRRCTLSSITSFERIGEQWTEVDYREPAGKNAVDKGAI